jgi:hypothetical protein
MMSMTFWHVYNWIAEQWYEHEYGKVENADSLFHPAMIELEELAYSNQKRGALYTGDLRDILGGGQ